MYIVPCFTRTAVFLAKAKKKTDLPEELGICISMVGPQLITRLTKGGRNSQRRDEPATLQANRRAPLPRRFSPPSPPARRSSGQRSGGRRVYLRKSEVRSVGTAHIPSISVLFSGISFASPSAAPAPTACSTECLRAARTRDSTRRPR
jgi:hypothetical protein